MNSFVEEKISSYLLLEIFFSFLGLYAEDITHKIEILAAFLVPSSSFSVKILSWLLSNIYSA